MRPHADIDLVVFDILGTLVNEPGGLHDSIRELVPRTLKATNLPLTSTGSLSKSRAVVHPNAFSFSLLTHGTSGAHKHWDCARPMSNGRSETHLSPPTHSTTTPPASPILWLRSSTVSPGDSRLLK
jgi:hypothetical protein